MNEVMVIFGENMCFGKLAPAVFIGEVSDPLLSTGSW